MSIRYSRSNHAVVFNAVNATSRATRFACRRPYPEPKNIEVPLKDAPGWTVLAISPRPNCPAVSVYRHDASGLTVNSHSDVSLIVSELERPGASEELTEARVSEILRGKSTDHMAKTNRGGRVIKPAKRYDDADEEIKKR